MTYKMRAEKEIKELDTTIREDKQHREQEEALERARRQTQDLTLGLGRKEALNELTEGLGLSDMNNTIDFLSFHFAKSETFDKESLFYLAELRKQ
ncbi:hypothetical protein D3C74_427050 [compost metagenome]